jgi:hypothetical protein
MKWAVRLARALKERNNLLFQENLRLQQEQQGVVWRSTVHDQQQMPPLGATKISNADSKHFKRKYQIDV